MEPIRKDLFAIKKPAETGGITTPYSHITSTVVVRERPEVLSIPEVVAREKATWGKDVQYEVVEPEPAMQFKIQPWHLLAGLVVLFLIAKK
jgi:hypothetical protein